jgi:hypothetical protein
LPTKTVYTRLARALERLRQRLARRGVSVSVAALAGLLANEAAAAVPRRLASATAHAALLAVAGRHLGGAGRAAPASLLAEASLKSLTTEKLKFAAIVVLGALVIGGGLVALHSANHPDARAGQTGTLLESMLLQDSRAPLQNFGQVYNAWAYNEGRTFSISFAQAPNNASSVIGGFRLLNATGQRNFYGSRFAVTLGPRTATGQQVILNSEGSMSTVVAGRTVGTVPIKITLVVNLTATPLTVSTLPAGSTCRVATMIFTAVNANTGANIVKTGILSGGSMATP